MKEVVVVAEVAQGRYREVSVGTELVQDLVAELSQLRVGVVRGAGGGGSGCGLGGVPCPPVVHQGEDRV